MPVTTKLKRLGAGDTRDDLDRVSAFHITVNPNIGWSDHISTEEFDGVIVVFGDKLLSKFVKYLEGSIEDIIDSSMEWQIEPGGKYNASIHAHILIKIIHRCKIQIDDDMTRKYFKKYLGKGTKINRDYLRGSYENAVKRYIRKGGMEG